VPGEETLLEGWKKEDSDFFNSINAMEYYMKLQNEDFADAIQNDRKPLVSGEDGRVTVELFTAIYRSTRDNQPVKFPLEAETDRDDFDGRI
jgi:predicted dehydrogenase